MAAPAGQLFASIPTPVRWRVWALPVTLLSSLALAILAAQVSPFLPAGANLEDAGQRAFARNIWPQCQVSLVVLALFAPWLVYARLAPFPVRGMWGRGLRYAVLTVAGLGTGLGIWMSATSMAAYVVRPQRVEGVVSLFQGRTLRLDGDPRRYALVLTADELSQATGWATPGTHVVMWVTGSGHAGYLGRVGGRPVPAQ